MRIQQGNQEKMLFGQNIFGQGSMPAAGKFFKLQVKEDGQGGNPIQKQKANAVKQALRVQLKAFGHDSEIDDAISQSKDRIDELHAQAGQAIEELNTISEMRKQLEENKGAMSGEEYKAASEQYDEMEKVWDSRLDSARGAMESIGKSIVDIQINRGKTHEMVDANKEADQILAAASRNAISQMVQEGMDYLDELQEEQKQAAEKAKEEQEKKEAQRKASDSGEKTAAQEDRELTEAVLENADRAKKEAQKMVQAQQLIEEDLKGLMMDEIG